VCVCCFCETWDEGDRGIAVYKTNDFLRGNIRDHTTPQQHHPGELMWTRGDMGTELIDVGYVSVTRSFDDVYSASYR